MQSVTFFACLRSLWSRSNVYNRLANNYVHNSRPRLESWPRPICTSESFWYEVSDYGSESILVLRCMAMASRKKVSFWLALYGSKQAALKIATANSNRSPEYYKRFFNLLKEYSAPRTVHSSKQVNLYIAATQEWRSCNLLSISGLKSTAK